MELNKIDYYLNDENTKARLLKEWRQYERIVVAYDFDNTVYDFHHEGQTYYDVIELLREANQLGAYLVVFTASAEENYPFIKSYLKDKDIPFDSINENPIFIPFGNNKKIYFNILLDDRAGLKSAYETLKYVIKTIKGDVKFD